MVYSINLDSRTDMSISETEPKVGSLRDGKSYQSIICHFTEVNTKDMWMISNSYRASHLCITLKISEHKSAVKNCDICLKKKKKWKYPRSVLSVLTNVKHLNWTLYPCIISSIPHRQYLQVCTLLWWGSITLPHRTLTINYSR